MNDKQINIFEKRKLADATLEQLFTEICRRCDDCILVSDIQDKLPGEKSSNIMFFGTTAQVMGLIAYAQLEINKRVLQSIT